MITVLGSRILIKGESLDNYQSNIIFVPDLYQRAPMRHGEVVRVGPEVENIRAGDVVFFHEHAGHTLAMDETTSIVLSEDDALGYSPDVVDLTMAEDTEIKQLREQSEIQREANAESKRLTDELKDALEQAKSVLADIRFNFHE